jgi:hypothetical protein
MSSTRWGSSSRIHQRTAPQKGGSPLGFMNIQPPKGDPPLEFININLKMGDFYGSSGTNIVQVHLDPSKELYKCYYIIYYQAHRSGRGLASRLPVGPVAAVGRWRQWAGRRVKFDQSVCMLNVRYSFRPVTIFSSSRLLNPPSPFFFLPTMAHLTKVLFIPVFSVRFGNPEKYSVQKSHCVASIEQRKIERQSLV